jgi:hypothetical protein
MEVTMSQFRLVAILFALAAPMLLSACGKDDTDDTDMTTDTDGTDTDM